MNRHNLSATFRGVLGVLLTGVFLAAVPACAQAPAEIERVTGELWGSINDELDSTVALLDKDRELQSKSNLPFYDYLSETKESNLRKINHLLDEAISALEISGLNNSRVEIIRLRSQIEQSRGNIDTYRRKRVSARSEPLFGFNSVPGFRTKATFDKYIEAEKKSIEEAEKQIALAKKECAAQLRKSGLKISDDAVDGLFETVTGDDIISMVAIFQNVKLLTKQLETLASQSSEDMESSRRYYGMYVVLLKVLDRMQNKFISDVDNVYIVRLEEFKEKANANIAKAEKEMEVEGLAPVVKKGYQANIETNLRTRQVADLYIGYLQEQRAEVASENQRLAKSIQLASNTYDTVKLSSEVVELLRSSRESFSALMSLQVPDLARFEDAAMKKELQAMTNQMKAAAR